MQEFTHTYRVESRVLRRIIPLVLRMSGSFNSHKIGRCHRHTLMLRGVDSDDEGDGVFVLRLHYVRNVRMHWRFAPAGPRWAVYPAVDFRKLLKLLATHAAPPQDCTAQLE